MASISDAGILIAQGHHQGADQQCFLRPDKANRHRRTLGDRVYPAAAKRLASTGKAA